VKKEAILAALKSFKSVKRRLEVRAEIAGITVIEDFAHHPPPSAKRCARCGPSIQNRGCGSAGAALEHAARKVSKPISWQACAWPIAWCSPRLSAATHPDAERLHRRMWSAT